MTGTSSSSRTTRASESRSCINARHVALVARLRELRADMDVDAIEAGDKLKAKLSELSHIIEGGIVDGWASLGNNVKSRLERWLVESARHLPTQNHRGGDRGALDCQRRPSPGVNRR